MAKSNFEKAKELLLSKGCKLKDIEEAISGKTKNKDKFNAIQGLMAEFDVSATDNTNTKAYPTIDKYFSKPIADLLMARKKIVSKKSISIDNIKDKKLYELSIDEAKQYIAYAEFIKKQDDLSKIDASLAKLGIKFVTSVKSNS